MVTNNKRMPYTLVELLVVTAIVFILVSLMLSALHFARMRGMDTSCLNNLRQIAVITHSFAMDHNGIVPPFGNSDEWRCGREASWIPEYIDSVRLTPPVDINISGTGSGPGYDVDVVADDGTAGDYDDNPDTKSDIRVAVNGSAWIDPDKMQKTATLLQCPKDTKWCKASDLADNSYDSTYRGGLCMLLDTNSGNDLDRWKRWQGADCEYPAFKGEFYNDGKEESDGNRNNLQLHYKLRGPFGMVGDNESSLSTDGARYRGRNGPRMLPVGSRLQDCGGLAVNTCGTYQIALSVSEGIGTKDEIAWGEKGVGLPHSPGFNVGYYDGSSKFIKWISTENHPHGGNQWGATRFSYWDKTGKAMCNYYGVSTECNGYGFNTDTPECFSYPRTGSTFGRDPYGNDCDGWGALFK